MAQRSSKQQRAKGYSEVQSTCYNPYARRPVYPVLLRLYPRGVDHKVSTFKVKLHQRSVTYCCKILREPHDNQRNLVIRRRPRLDTEAVGTRRRKAGNHTRGNCMMQQSTSKADYYSSCAHSTGICQHLVPTVGVRWPIWVSGPRAGAGRGTEIGDWALHSRLYRTHIATGRPGRYNKPKRRIGSALARWQKSTSVRRWRTAPRTEVVRSLYSL